MTHSEMLDEMRQDMLEDSYREEKQEKKLHRDLEYALETLEVDGYGLVDIDDLLTKFTTELSSYGHELSRKELLEYI